MLSNSKVLVVDDIASNLEVITEVLSSAGYQVATSISGERALKRLQKYTPDLILLDIKMSGLDGFETFQRIRAKPELSDIPVIFITAYADTESIVKGFSFGAVDYISKPFQELELLARVKTHLQLRQTSTQIKQQAIRERVLRQIVENIHCSLDLGTILCNAATQIQQQMGATRVFVHRYFSPTESQVLEASKHHTSPPSTSLWPFSLDISDYTLPLTEPSLSGTNSEIKPEKYPLETAIDSLQNYACPELSFPLFLKEKAWGILVVGFSSEAVMPSSCESALQAIAKQLEIAIQQAHLYHQLELANTELTRLANLDGLTQLSNRRCFDTRLEQEWLRLHREQQPLSLIMVDIDYFKLFNDTYGHCQGDSCLKAVAKALSQVVQRPADLIARYGGEEFVVILPNTNAAGALELAQHMQRSVQQLQITHRTHLSSNYITVSLGVATCIPTLEASHLAFLDCVDQALYQAKAKGRNCYYMMDFSAK